MYVTVCVCGGGGGMHIKVGWSAQQLGGRLRRTWELPFCAHCARSPPAPTSWPGCNPREPAWLDGTCRRSLPSRPSGFESTKFSVSLLNTKSERKSDLENGNHALAAHFGYLCPSSPASPEGTASWTPWSCTSRPRHPGLPPAGWSVCLRQKCIQMFLEGWGFAWCGKQLRSGLQFTMW